MTKETLALIISDNFEQAKRGDAFAISAIIGANDELEKIKQLEKDIAFAQIVKGEIDWEKNLESAWHFRQSHIKL